jgi:hypothetical protein
MVIRCVAFFTLPSRRRILALRLLKFKTEPNGDSNVLQCNYRFAVVDSTKTSGYPSNFVCMLPMKIGEGSTFVKMFGAKSLEQAQLLLKDSLKRESDSEVKVELERRLKLLEPKENSPIKCCYCGKQFLPQGVRRYKSYFCPECSQRSYGRR